MAGTRLVLCEGYTDMTFVGELLVSGFGASVAGDALWGGTPLRRGQHGYQTPHGDLLVVDQTRNVREMGKVSRLFLGRVTTRPFDRLILIADDDTEGRDGHATHADRVDAVRALAREIAPVVEVTGLSWRCDDPPRDGVPEVQTLERLVCAALLDRWPDRAPAVQAFLDAEPAGPERRRAKGFFLAHAGKWFPAKEPSGVLKLVAGSEDLRARVEARLRATGGWDVLQRVVNA